MSPVGTMRVELLITGLLTLTPVVAGLPFWNSPDAPALDARNLQALGHDVAASPPRSSKRYVMDHLVQMMSNLGKRANAGWYGIGPVTRSVPSVVTSQQTQVSQIQSRNKRALHLSRGASTTTGFEAKGTTRSNSWQVTVENSKDLVLLETRDTGHWYHDGADHTSPPVLTAADWSKYNDYVNKATNWACDQACQNYIHSFKSKVSQIKSKKPDYYQSSTAPGTAYLPGRKNPPSTNSSPGHHSRDLSSAATGDEANANEAMMTFTQKREQTFGVKKGPTQVERRDVEFLTFTKRGPPPGIPDNQGIWIYNGVWNNKPPTITAEDTKKYEAYLASSHCDKACQDYLDSYRSKTAMLQSGLPDFYQVFGSADWPHYVPARKQAPPPPDRRARRVRRRDVSSAATSDQAKGLVGLMKRRAAGPVAELMAKRSSLFKRTGLTPPPLPKGATGLQSVWVYDGGWRFTAPVLTAEDKTQYDKYMATHPCDATCTHFLDNYNSKASMLKAGIPDFYEVLGATEGVHYLPGRKPVPNVPARLTRARDVSSASLGDEVKRSPSKGDKAPGQLEIRDAAFDGLTKRDTPAGRIQPPPDSPTRRRRDRSSAAMNSAHVKTRGVDGPLTKRDNPQPTITGIWRYDGRFQLKAPVITQHDTDTYTELKNNQFSCDTTCANYQQNYEEKQKEIAANQPDFWVVRPAGGGKPSYLPGRIQPPPNP